LPELKPEPFLSGGGQKFEPNDKISGLSVLKRKRKIVKDNEKNFVQKKFKKPELSGTSQATNLSFFGNA